MQENSLRKRLTTDSHYEKVAPMKEQKRLADKLRELKQGESFLVASETERQTVCRIVKALRDTGYLQHAIITKKSGKQFIVAAI